MRNVALASGLVFIVASLGCSKSDSDKDSTTGAFLTPSTFTSASSKTLDADELKMKLQGEDDLYDNKPSTGGSTPTTDTSDSMPPEQKACIEKQAPKAQVVSKETLSISADVDLGQCAPAQTGTANPSLTDSIKMKFVMNISCPGADFSSLNGKTVSELGLDEASSGVPSSLEEQCKSASAVKIFVNGSFDFAGAFKGTFATFTTDGSACELVKVNGGYKSTGCLNASLTEFSYTINGAPQKESNLTILESNNIIDLDTSTAQWFNGGSFTATFNNFKGTVTYSNSSTAPTFSLTAAGGLTASGTLGDSSGQADTGDTGETDSFATASLTQNPFSAVQVHMKKMMRYTRSFGN